MPDREHERQLTARQYLEIIARRKWLVFAALAAALVGSVLLSLLQDAIYTAEAEVLVEARSGGGVFQQDQALAVQNLDRAIQTEIQVMEGQQVRERVRQDLGLSSLPPKVSASAINNTDVVEVQVRSGDARTAQRLTDAYVSAYTSTRRDQAVEALGAAGGGLQGKIAELQGELDTLDQEISAAPVDEPRASLDALISRRELLESQQATFEQRLDQLQVDSALTTGGASVVKSATLPVAPSEPTPARTAALALLVGLVIGVGAALLIDHFDDSIQSAGDLDAVTNVPLLAVVPVEPPPDHRPIALSEPQDVAVEAYRGLRTNVQFVGLDEPMRIVQVSSSLPGEGKTTTAANLAVVLAQSGRSVVIVDADLRRPRLHEVFSAPSVPGLTEVLLGDPVDLVVNHLGHGLHLVTAGTLASSPSEMLSSPRMVALLHELAERFDFVVIDSAPILPVADSVALSVAVEGVLMVVQAGRTSRTTVRDALGQLGRVQAAVRGIVLNRVERGRNARDGYGYGYGYGHRERSAVANAAEPPMDTPAPASSAAFDPF